MKIINDASLKFLEEYLNNATATIPIGKSSNTHCEDEPTVKANFAPV